MKLKLFFISLYYAFKASVSKFNAVRVEEYNTRLDSALKPSYYVLKSISNRKYINQDGKLSRRIKHAKRFSSIQEAQAKANEIHAQKQKANLIDWFTPIPDTLVK